MLLGSFRLNRRSLVGMYSWKLADSVKSWHSKNGEWTSEGQDERLKKIQGGSVLFIRLKAFILAWLQR